MRGDAPRRGLPRRAVVLSICCLLAADLLVLRRPPSEATAAPMGEPGSRSPAKAAGNLLTALVAGALAIHRGPDASAEPSPQAAPPPPPAKRPPAPAASKAPPAAAPPPAPPLSPPPPPDPLEAYRGLGAWVDLFDFARPGTLPPEVIVDELARRGVRTLYLQTARWNSAPDIVHPSHIATFLTRAHQHGIRVVGWYLPGFADIDRDLRRTLALLEFSTPAGDRFDGVAPDIEDRRAVGESRVRFNAGVAEYSRRLRESVPPGTVLGAIVPDAKNNERAPRYWEGFPWPEIARFYDVVLPMAYWSVTKPACGRITLDAAGYIREVLAKTQALMGVEKPMHPIGGIADCDTVREVTLYVQAVKETGSVGGSLYDFATNNANPARDLFWRELGRLNP
ncbi:MAG: hypothetical protein ACRDJ4_03380 [Actinomycetota bacterium]